MSFGKSALEAKPPRYVVQRMDYVLQIMDGSYVLGFNASNGAVSYLYNYRTDKDLKKDIQSELLMAAKKLELENQLKAMIQRFDDGFMNNRLLY